MSLLTNIACVQDILVDGPTMSVLLVWSLRGQALCTSRLTASLAQLCETPFHGI